MCGLCGIFAADPNATISRTEVIAMRDSLEHRGPDDAGVYIGAGAGLGSRRLSIVDLSERGHMPMASEDRRYWIAYNGEVYNYRALRATLEARGHRFRSNTDTEVVLALYALEGPRMLEKLNGMFAFAIWDTREHSGFIARDRLGVKPLYYHVDRDALRFGSEPKALFVAGVEPSFDHDTWRELLCFRYVAGERTPLRGVQSLLPGHYLTWKAGELRITRWWKLADRIAERRESLPRSPVEWFRELLDDSVGLRRIADVPVGVMLSGGLDSSAVAASLATMTGPGAHGFTVAFDESTHDEAPLARRVVDRWQMIGHEIRITRADLLDRLRQASRFLDAPLAHLNDAHMLALSQVAKSQVKVLLSGEGADETLNGYVRYQPLRFPLLLAAAERASSLGLGRFVNGGRAKKLMRMLAERGTRGLVQYNACELFPSELDELGLRDSGEDVYRSTMLDEARSAYPGDLLRQAMYLDQHTFLVSLLDRNDRMTMGASIECRVPFLDYRIVETLAALPTSALTAGGMRKSILRRASRKRLPLAIQLHKKWGFPIPWAIYFREVPELRHEVERLPDCDAITSSPLDRKVVRSTVARFLAGDLSTYPLVSRLVMVSVWYDGAIGSRRHDRAAAVL
jgi:asparagine synthase (glutamine-hydrolysing)